MVREWKTPPYLISTLEQLKAFRNEVNDGNTYAGIFVKLTADLDLKGSEKNQWTPIGKAVWNEETRTYDGGFAGTFDGDGHKITGLYINNSEEYQGLFGYIGSGATVKNLNVDGTVTGSDCVGGVVGLNIGGTVENCCNTGSVTGSYFVGGVVGVNDGGTVENCCNTGSVSGSEDVGGVVGDNYGTLENCYNTGSVNGSEDVGGVAGDNYEGTVKNCYNTGSVSGSDCVGGVVGVNYGGTVKNCYYLDNCAAEGTTFDCDEGTVLTAEQMKDSESFTGFDFTKVWKMGIERPLLRAIPEDESFGILSTGTSDTKATATVFIPTAGTYTVIFADYENGRLAKISSVQLAVTEDTCGTHTVTSLDDMTLGADDKIMLWESLGTLVPLCEAYVIK